VPEAPDWQAALADAVRDPAELCRLLGLDTSLVAGAQAAAKAFPPLVPRPYLSRMRPGDPKDPLLVQVLPTVAESTPASGYSTDPLGEARVSPCPGLLQKYRGRSLIVATGRCGVHCRFCFRRHFPYGADRATNSWEPALRQIAADRSIREVILSGGDPLTLPDRRLEQCIGRLAGIEHVRRVRLHTRLPIVLPQRITDSLSALLRGTRLLPVVVVHVNHPAEIDDEVASAVGRLADAGTPLLQQGVLLRGVNDDVDVLAELYQRLIELRVFPYYLHQLDPVAGAAHFEVPIPVGVHLVSQLRTRLPGYAAPRYVREIPGEACKRVLA
jgi:EF-P beta-lysylation protein EpmB